MGGVRSGLAPLPGRRQWTRGRSPTTHPPPFSATPAPGRAVKRFVHHHGMLRAEAVASQLRRRLSRAGLPPFDLGSFVATLASGFFCNAAHYILGTEHDPATGGTGTHMYRLLRHTKAGEPPWRRGDWGAGMACARLIESGEYEGTECDTHHRRRGHRCALPAAPHKGR